MRLRATQFLPNRIVVVILLCAFGMGTIVAEAIAQRFTFRRIGTEQGLSQCTILAMLQDHYGFMWLCTQDGLNRYDGYGFKVYKHNAEDSVSLSSSMSISIFEDRFGTIWVGTYNGLNRLNRTTGKFRRYYPDSLRIPQRCSIWSISEIPDGRLVVATSNGLFQFDAEKDYLREFVSADSSASVFKGKVCHRIVDNTGRFVVRVERRLYAYHPEKNSFTPLDFTPNNINPNGNMLMPIFIDKQGGYWSISEARADSSLLGLYRFMPASFPNASHTAAQGAKHQQKSIYSPEQWIRFRPSAMNIQSMVDMVGRIFQDSQNRIWVQTLNGLNLFDPVHNRFTLFQHNPADPLSLGANRIVSMYEDRSGLLWVASNGSGVNIMLPQKFLLYRLSDAPTLQKQGRFHFLKGIAEDRNGALWIAEYDHGLRKFDRTAGTFTEHKDVKSAATGGITSLLCLHADKDGRIWFGGSFNRLGYFHPATKTFRYFGSIGNAPAADDALWINYMRFLTEDYNGFLWLATDRNGLQVFSKHHERYVAHFLDNHDVSSVFVARSGTVYAGTDGAGMFVFSPIADSYDAYGLPRFAVKHFKHQPNDSTTLSANNTIKYFHEDARGYIWLGMDGGGLNCFDPRTGAFVRYSERDGLPNNVVYSILPDSRNNLWLSTNKGLSKFNPGNRTFRNYDVTDGLQGNEFNTNAFARLRTGEMLFGGIGGINIFHPDSVRDNVNPPPVMLTEILVNDKPKQFDKPPEDVRELTLRYDENTLSFTFAGLDYMNSAKNQYMYKLEGMTNVIDKDWVQSGTGRTVRYAALPQGEYVFRVKACNNDGVWNEQGIALKIKLIPPFWREVWFYMVCVLIGLGGGTGLVRTVVRRRLVQRIERLEHERALERARLERELAIERERGRIAQDIHDEVGPGITKILLLSGYADTVVQNGGHEDPTRNGGFPLAPVRNPLSQAAQEVIDSMNDIIWMTNPKNDTLDNLMAYIREYAAEYLSQASIACRFDIPDTVPPMHLYGTLRRNIFLTVKEALNNIVKHAHASETTITLVFDETYPHGGAPQQTRSGTVLSPSATHVVTAEHRFQLRISDDGKGVTSADRSRFGNGLDNMRRRMEECGCSFTVLTGDEDGRGTTITLDILIFSTPYLERP